MNPKRILSRSIAAIVILAPVAGNAGTQTITAAGDPLIGTSGINPAWGTAANWSGTGGAVLPGVADIAQITYAGTTRAGVDIRGSGFAGNVTEVQGVSFVGTSAVEVDLENNSTGSNMTLILNGGAGTVPLIQTGTYFAQIVGHGLGATTTTTKTLTLQLKGSGEINVGTGGLTLSALMSEATAGKSITKTGAGRLTMSLAAADGNNAFTGGATVTSGVLEVTANGVLGTGSVVVNGGTLEVNIASATLTNSSIAVNAGGQIATRGNVTLSNSLTLNGGTLATRSSDGGTFAGAINVTANSFANLRSYTTPANSQSITISGLLSGGSSLTINGNDPQTNGLNKALILTNTANTFSGAFNVSNNQILRNLPAGTGKTIGTSAVNLNGGALQLRDDGAGSDGALGYGNNVTAQGVSTIDVDHVAANTANIFNLGTLSLGAGTLTVSGANGYGVRFGATALTGAATVNATTATATFGGIVSGAFSFTKAGAGNLILSVASTFSGQTNVDGGTLTLVGSIASTPRIDVKAGALLDVTNAAGGFTLGGSQILSGAGSVTGAMTVASGGKIEAGNVLGAGTLTASNLTFAGAAALRVTPSASALGVHVTGTGALVANGGAGSVVVNIGGVSPAVGQYVLVDYDGAIGGTGFGAFTLGTLPTARLAAALVNNGLNSSIDLNVTGVDFPIWKGALGTEWSTNVLANPKNWVLNSNNANTTDFLASDTVIFNDIAAPAAPVVNVSVADVVPSSIVFSNAAKPYTISGTKAIAGAGGLAKNGAAKVTISNTNTFSGAVTIGSAGTLSVPAVADAGVASPLGTGGAIALDGGTLEFTGALGSTNRPIALGVSGGTVRVDSVGATLTLTGSITGAAIFTKTGPGKLIVAAANSHDATTISGGALEIGDTGGLGTGVVTNDSALIFNRSNATLVVTNDIGGPGSVEKTGAGTVTIGGTGSNIYSGTTTVTNGTLVLGKTAGSNAIGGDLIVGNGTFVRYLNNNVSNQIAETASITINGGTFGDTVSTGPTNPGATDTVANVAVNSGTFNSGRNATVGLFNITDLLRVAGGTVLAQRGGGISANGVAFTGGTLNLDGGSTSAGQQSRLNIGTGGLTLAGTTINLNAGPSAITPTSVGSVITLGGDVTSTGISAIARLNPTFSAAIVDLGGAVRTINVTGTLAIAADAGNAATDLGAAGIHKTGTGKLVLEGAQSYASLTNDAGRTDVLKAIGTGTSTVAANAGQIHFATGQTLASLTIGDGAVVAIGTPLPAAPPEAIAFESADFVTAESATAVPEPGSAALLLGAIATLFASRLRKEGSGPLAGSKNRGGL